MNQTTLVALFVFDSLIIICSFELFTCELDYTGHLVTLYVFDSLKLVHRSHLFANLAKLVML